MKRMLLSIMLLCCFSSWVAAESSVWKAQKGAAVIYLGGTCHLLRAADYPLPAEFDRAYRAADMVIFETDIGKLREPATQQKLLGKAMYADGSTVENRLSARTYGELRAYCEASGIPLQALSRFKPAMLMTVLTLLELNKLGVSEMGVDRFYHELAKKEGKSVAGLETVDEQLNYLLSMADGQEEEFVAYSLKEMKNVREQFEILAAAWRSGDAARLDELMVAELKAGQPQLYKKLITERNRNWLPLIDVRESPLRTKFILVGVGHLVGPDGLLEALKKKGYKVNKL